MAQELFAYYKVEIQKPIEKLKPKKEFTEGELISVLFYYLVNFKAALDASPDKKEAITKSYDILWSSFDQACRLKEGG
jgi:hypothetical protein